MGVGVRKRNYLVDVRVSETRVITAVSRQAAEECAERQLVLEGMMPTANTSVDIECVGTLDEDKDGKPVHNYFE